PNLKPPVRATAEPRVIQLKPMVISKSDVNVVKLLPLQAEEIIAAEVRDELRPAPAEPQPEAHPFRRTLSFNEFAAHLVQEELRVRAQAQERAPAKEQTTPPPPPAPTNDVRVADNRRPPSDYVPDIHAPTVTVNGTLEFAEGLAITSPTQRVVVQRYIN